MDGDPTSIGFYALYAVSYIISIVAFMMTNIQLLRILVVLSSAGYVVYYYGFPAEPLWMDVGTEFAFVLVNLFMLMYLYWSNSRIQFTQREQFLYQSEFPALNRLEFRKLLEIGQWSLDGPGHTYTRVGEHLSHIYYLVSGRAEAEFDDGNSAVMTQGSVIGEVSYQLQRPASATVISTEPCLTVQWKKSDLQALCDKSENIKQAVNGVLSSHMAQKLSRPITPAVASDATA